MAELVDPKNIPQAQQDELAAYLQEMRNDYNQRHFVRNETFKAAADKLSGPTRKIFIEFLERSCTAEFSGFLLFKELGRRLKTVNPVVAGEWALQGAAEASSWGECWRLGRQRMRLNSVGVLPCYMLAAGWLTTVTAAVADGAQHTKPARRQGT
jgi:hypothetical protein